MRDHSNHLGMIATPAQGNKVEDGFVSIVDNSLFADEYPGDGPFLDMLRTKVRGRGRCLFVVAPDVPGKAVATLERSAPMFGPIRKEGFNVALAAQNGLESRMVPWDDFEVLFLGGGPECVPCGYTHPLRDRSRLCPHCGYRLTEWKVGRQAVLLTAEARRRDKTVHMGRVNSFERLKKAHDMGCASADGTYLVFGPDINLPKLLGWLRAVNDQGVLFEEAS